MGTVLIATADGMLAEILEAEVLAENHRVILRDNGKDALDSIFAGEADLALLDRELPIFSGLQLCRLVRDAPDFNERPSLILITDEAVAPRVLEKSGANAVFPKTHHAAAVRELLAWQMPDETY